MGLVYSEPSCQAAYEGDVHQLYHLLSKDPTQLNVQEEHNGDTPLIAACRHGKLRVVQYLLENRADVHLTNKKQRTCLHYVSKRTLSLLDYLMVAILMPILLLGYFLMLQKRRQQEALMKEVLSSDVNIDAVDYLSSQQWELERCHTELAMFKYKKSENHFLLVCLTSVRFQKGNAALHYICQRKSHRLVRLLLERNADTNIQNNDGETPLDIATRLKFTKIVKMLKKAH